MNTLILLLSLICADGKSEKDFGAFEKPKEPTFFSQTLPPIQEEKPSGASSYFKDKDKSKISSLLVEKISVYDKSGKVQELDKGDNWQNALKEINSKLPNTNYQFDRWGQRWHSVDTSYLSKWIDEENLKPNKTIQVQTQPQPQTYYYSPTYSLDPNCTTTA